MQQQQQQRRQSGAPDLASGSSKNAEYFGITMMK